MTADTEYLRNAKQVLLAIIAMNRAARRSHGWKKSRRHYQAQLYRVMRDLGEIA